MSARWSDHEDRKLLLTIIDQLVAAGGTIVWKDVASEHGKSYSAVKQRLGTIRRAVEQEETTPAAPATPAAKPGKADKASAKKQAVATTTSAATSAAPTATINQAAPNGTKRPGSEAPTSPKSKKSKK